MGKMFFNKSSEVQEGKVFPHYTKSDKKIIKIYRYDPESGERPRMDTFYLSKDAFGNMLLDALMYIKDHVDQSLVFRKSCRETVCGSCGMNINGVNGLACSTTLDSHNTFVVRPLPGLPVLKDLVPDLSGPFEQYKSIQPWMKHNNDVDLTRPALQTTEQRAQLDGLWECILCFCCTTGCPSYWWNGDNGYLGPAVLMQAHRWVQDTRDDDTINRLKFLSDSIKLYRCHTIVNCTSVCPKDLNPAASIGELKKKVLSVSYSERD